MLCAKCGEASDELTDGGLCIKCAMEAEIEKTHICDHANRCNCVCSHKEAHRPDAYCGKGKVCGDCIEGHTCVPAGPKKAYLVEISLMTRVVIPADLVKFDEHADFNDDFLKAVREQAVPRLKDKLDTDFHDNLESIYEDEEVPYDPATDS